MTVMAAITVSPSSIGVRPQGTIKFSAMVTGVAAGVTWSVQEGASGGSITPGGDYTAPAAVGTYHVVATSTASPSLQGRATVSVVAPITDLPIGTWTDMTPPELKNGRTRMAYVGLSASDPSVAYMSTNDSGIWRTADSGKTWRRCGNPNGANGEAMTEYLDNASRIEVDPADPDHFYATEGVDGARHGFWVSRDAGATYHKPQGFRDIAKMVGGPGHDVVALAVDAADFKHILLSPHSDWGITSGYSSGILESRDGGESWIAHMPPGDAWANGTKGVHILHHPATGQGNADTWLVTDEAAGFWRTADAGKSWNKVSDARAPHGGNQFFYAKDGTLYSGAVQLPMRSKDNGVTWQRVEKLPAAPYYQTLFGTGSLLFTMGYSESDSQFFYTSSEDDGVNWKEDTAFGKTAASPWELRYDSVNRILYAPSRHGGLWLLRLPE
jgi:photosystem II stability/assembly factor-like uncharacterized protein